jgi:hypothetical protein
MLTEEALRRAAHLGTCRFWTLNVPNQTTAALRRYIGLRQPDDSDYGLRASNNKPLAGSADSVAARRRRQNDRDIVKHAPRKRCALERPERILGQRSPQKATCTSTSRWQQRADVASRQVRGHHVTSLLRSALAHRLRSVTSACIAPIACSWSVDQLLWTVLAGCADNVRAVRRQRLDAPDSRNSNVQAATPALQEHLRSFSVGVGFAPRLGGACSAPLFAAAAPSFDLPVLVGAMLPVRQGAN